MRQRTCAVVIRPSLTWQAGLNPHSEATYTETPAWAYTEWGRVVDICARWCEAAGSGVVLVQGGPLDLAVSDRERRLLGVHIVNTLQEHGWKTSESGIETGWFFCEATGGGRRRAGMVMMLGIGPWIRQDRTPLFDLEMTAPASVVASRLAVYHRETGVSWRGTGGLSGCALLREMKATTREPLWRWDKAPSDVVGSSFELYAGRHWRAASADERDMFVHRFDTRAMYLAAAGNADLAWSAPVQSGAQEFDPERPGYWRIDARKINDPMHLLTRDCDGLAWVTTPIMSHLLRRGVRPEIHDSITADRQSRIMRGWAERLRDARTNVQRHGHPIVPAIKDTYSRTVGQMKRSGGRVFRPDWRDTIVDLAKCNLLDKIHKSGLAPLRFQTDAVWVASPNPHGRLLFPDPGHIGALRFEETMSMTDYLKKHEENS